MSSESLQSSRGFTLTELLVMLAIIGILAALLLPTLAQGNQQARDIQCISKLKQVALGFKLFATDHDGRYPWQSAVKQGGTYGTLAGASWRNYLAASNELASPLILACPSDRDTPPAVTWSAGAQGFAGVARRGKALSYFTGLDSFEPYPLTFLAGDRNITGAVSDNCKSVAAKPGVAALLLDKDNTDISWSATIHRSKGNIAVTDGSVEKATARSLRTKVSQAAIQLASRNLMTQGGSIPNNHILPPR